MGMNTVGGGGAGIISYLQGRVAYARPGSPPASQQVGQHNTTLSNGLNSNIPTSGRVTIRVDGPTAAFSVGGFASQSAWTGGNRIVVTNTTPHALTIVHDDASSVASNRISTPNGLPIIVPARSASIAFVYDDSISRFVPEHTGFRYDRVFDVRDFGAVGNGSHDDTQAFQAAIDAAGFGGAVYVPLPPNFYVITQPLDFTNAMGIRFCGDSFGVDAQAAVGPQAQIKAQFPSISGTAASITSLGHDPNVAIGLGAKLDVITVTGLANLSTVQQGDTITLSNCASSGNDGSFTILSVDAGAGSVTAYDNNFDISNNPLAVAPDGNNGSIHWNVKHPMLKVWVRSVLIEGLWLDGNNTVSAVIDATWSNIQLCTNLNVRGCQLCNALWGVKIGDYGPRAQYAGNNDLFEFHRCYFLPGASGLACVYVPNATGQSKHHLFQLCNFGPAQYGIRTFAASFSTHHCGFTGHTICSIRLGESVDSIQIRDTDLESCARFLQVDGASNAPWPVVIDGGRFDTLPADIASDQQWIQWSLASCLVIRNCDFSEGVLGLDTFSIGLSGQSVGMGICLIEGCTFPTLPTNSIVTRFGGGPSVALSLNNVYDHPIAGVVRIPDGQISTDSGVQAFGWNELASASPACTLAVSNGANNDVARPNYTTSEITAPSGDYNITGFAGGYDGHIIELYNLTAHAMTLNNENVGSSAANRIHSFTGADVVCHYAKLRYSTSQSRWIICATS